MTIGYHAGSHFVLGTARMTKDKSSNSVRVIATNLQGRPVLLEKLDIQILPTDWSWQCETTMREKYEAHKRYPEIFELPNYEDIREECLRNEKENEQQEANAVARLQHLVDTFGPDSEFLKG